MTTTMTSARPATAPSATSNEAVKGEPSEMRDLLARYPQLDGADLDRLARLMRTAPHLEVGLLSSDPVLGERYYSFKGAEARRLRPTPWETARFLAFWLGPTALIIWGVMQVA